jgi:anti-sigma regulatory factor (Ser/Thr protein kinase)
VNQDGLVLEFAVRGMDFSAAGEAATAIRRACLQLGMPPRDVRRVAVIAYEAELNIVIHACHGVLRAWLLGDRVELVAEDSGPGIADLELAMQEGYTTAPPHVREMGFGAGMGLPNMKRHADTFAITSELEVGTNVWAVVRLGR